MWETVLIWTSAGLAAAGATAGTLSRDALIRRLAREHPRAWVRYGRPSGLFSGPRGSFLGGLDSNWQPIEGRWVFRTPYAVRSDRVALSLLLWHRIGFVVMLLGLVPLVVVGVAAAW